MKIFGMGVASLLLARCISEPPTQVTCYTVVPALDDTRIPLSTQEARARGRLRSNWRSFGELAVKTATGLNRGTDSWDDPLGQGMIEDHRATLDVMVRRGELSAPVADLVQEAYAAAVYHVWRSNAPMTCYEPMPVNYAPASAAALVHQSAVLLQIGEQGKVDPQTLAKAQAALEHDMAYYALTDADVQALHERILKDFLEDGQPAPSFEALQLELTSDARLAAQFILDLLAEK